MICPPQIGFARNITSNQLEVALEDKEISDLLSLMSDGNAYVNVRTDKYPDGAIRGQVTSATASTEQGPGTNTTSATMPRYQRKYRALTRLVLLQVRRRYGH